MGRALHSGPAAIAGGVIVVSALALSSCAAEQAPPVSASPPAEASPVETAPSETALPDSPEAVASGLAAPWSIAVWASDTGEDGVLVSERDTGRIVEVGEGGDLREVAEIDGVVHGGEGGLLGLAAHDGSLYVYATASDGNRVERYDLIGEPGAVSLGEATTVIDGLPAARTHNAGRIAFGPDGNLYVPVGDAGDPSAAQDPGRLNGKILRLTPDGSVPADNPTAGSAVYSLGHRNVQGLAWDEDGRLFASEFGQNTWDELNIISPGGNYGWPVAEGTGGEGRGFVDPMAQWPTDQASPSGIAIVGGTVLLANLRGEVLRAVSIADPAEQTEYYADQYGRLRDVTTGPDGAVWFLTNNTDGRGDPTGDDDRLLRVSPDAVSAD